MACNDNVTITVDPVNVTGSNSTGISSPHIISYPRPPRNNSGKLQALGSIIGAFIGRLANSGKLDDASDAEDAWTNLMGS